MSNIFPLVQNPLISDEELELLKTTLTKDYQPTTRDRLNRNLTRFFVWASYGADGWTQMIDERQGKRSGRGDARKAWVSEHLSQLSREFLHQGRIKAITKTAQYREFLKANDYAPATINSYLWAVREMVSQAKRLEVVDWGLRDVEGVPSETLRDTRGTNIEGIQKMLNAIDQSSLEGIRNYALIMLLFQNALRRGEVVGCNISHFDPTAKTLSIQGKGKRDRASIDLSASVVDAIQHWLSAREEAGLNAPLFCALDRNHYGHRLSGTSVYTVVRSLANLAEVSSRFSPHKIRHSAITAVLDATDGDLRSAQALSRHKSLEILQVYDDNRKQLQIKATGLLEEMVNSAQP
ncbi:MAG: tyrosine recombinase XerC [Cyanobacteriota bacterium]|jgi:integrase/recombinase XerC